MFIYKATIDPELLAGFFLKLTCPTRQSPDYFQLLKIRDGFAASFRASIGLCYKVVVLEGTARQLMATQREEKKESDRKTDELKDTKAQLEKREADIRNQGADLLRFQKESHTND